MIKKQFTLYLENKPGALSRITDKLAAGKINIEGISVSESTDVGLVQVVVSNAEKTKKILKRLSVPFTIQNVALLSITNKPGALAEIIKKLARTGVNINYIYATACECNKTCECYAVISAPDLKKLEKVW
jgi:hypothetical protein